MTAKMARDVMAALLVISWVTLASASCDGPPGRSAGRSQTPATGGGADASTGDTGKGGTQLDYSQPPPQATAPAPHAAAATPTVVPTAQFLSGDDPRVGALFVSGAYGSHFCTASVVQSPGHDLLMTAAHCLNDGKGQGKTSIVFVPGYTDGAAPYGVWTPRALIVDPQWAGGGDPDHDVGFVVLNPSDGENIQDAVGANQIDFNAGFTQLVQVTGYPETDNSPVTCQNWTTRYSATQLTFACAGFYGGTSGSPWIIASDAAAARTPQVVGVIGGYQRGGDTNSVSYSVYLGSAIETLYEQAKAASTAAVVPAQGTAPGPATTAG